MNQPLVRILLFGLLVLTIIYPFGGLAGLMLFLLGAAFLSTVSGVIEALANDNSKESS